ncbi:hypothetical protein AAE478_009102, partial [Parahypoxylon ruwenzoriense]
MSTNLPSNSNSNSSNTRSTRSSSPVELAGDLRNLEKPVNWLYLCVGDLSKKMARNPTAATLFRNIKRVPCSGLGYLPAELHDPLLDDLCLDPDDDEEFDKLDGIVNETNIFKTTPHAEAAWNQQVHVPMLELAVLHQPTVGFHDVTRANITRPFLPRATTDISLSSGGKMIDYVLALKGDERIRQFVGRLAPRCFNQTLYPPLTSCPTGVFLETKAKAQLGYWLAAWFRRISAFPGSPPGLPSPFPVLLAL